MEPKKEERERLLTSGQDQKKEEEQQKKKVKVREPLLLVACGKKGVGKTYTTTAMIRKQIKGNPDKAVKPQRVLIFDVNDEFGEFKKISLDKIALWCSGGPVEARRVSIFKAKEDVPFKIDGMPIFITPSGKMSLKEMSNALYYILQNFRNGLLLIEDINRYLSDSLPSDVIGTIVTQRHVGVDVVIHFQNIGRFGHPKILGNANFLRLHKTTDHVARHKLKFDEYIEPLTLAEIIVDKKFKAAKTRAEESCYGSFDVGKGKIKGQFTRADFQDAVTAYLERNSNTLIAPKMNEINLDTGGKKYNHVREVVQMYRDQLEKDYYGNDK